MTTQKRTRIIAAGLIATPFTGLILGSIAWVVSSHVPNADGTDLSKILPVAGFAIGLVGSVLGLVIGSIASTLARKTKSKDFLIAIYLLPSSMAMCYLIYLIIVNS